MLTNRGDFGLQIQTMMQTGATVVFLRGRFQKSTTLPSATDTRLRGSNCCMEEARDATFHREMRWTQRQCPVSLPLDEEAGIVL